jgi:hypothetical protein
MRNSLVMVVVAVLALAGCSKKEEALTRAVAEAASAGGTTEHPARFMAYEHFVQIDTREDKVVPLHEAALTACRQAVAEQCVVLNSQLSTGRSNSSSLKFRAKAAGIQKIIEVLGAQGEIVSQSTSAEDLAAPIADTAKQLEMLKDYRSNLEKLQARSAGDIESLIKVNKELAEVQSQIESLTGSHKHLLQRVDTQLLNVSIAPANAASFWRPVGLALADFGSHFSRAIAGAITAIAYLIPWGLTFFAFAWTGRKLWRRYRKPKAAS